MKPEITYYSHDWGTTTTAKATQDEVALSFGYTHEYRDIGGNPHFVKFSGSVAKTFLFEEADGTPVSREERIEVLKVVQDGVEINCKKWNPMFDKLH